jgi:hypothetical protein
MSHPPVMQAIQTPRDRVYGKQHFENIGRLGGLKGGAKTTALYGKQHFENIGRLGGAKTTALYGKQHFENIGRLGRLKGGLAKTAAAIKKAAAIADDLELPEDCHGFILLTPQQQKREVSKTYRAKFATKELGIKAWGNLRKSQEHITSSYVARVNALPKPPELKKQKMTEYFSIKNK